jgi:hypothetical protein
MKTITTQYSPETLAMFSRSERTDLAFNTKVPRYANGGKAGGLSGDRLTKGGRNGKIHTVVDRFCRPWASPSRPATPAIARWRKTASAFRPVAA